MTTNIADGDDWVPVQVGSIGGETASERGEEPDSRPEVGGSVTNICTDGATVGHQGGDFHGSIVINF